MPTRKTESAQSNYKSRILTFFYIRLRIRRYFLKNPMDFQTFFLNPMVFSGQEKSFLRGSNVSLGALKRHVDPLKIQQKLISGVP